MAVNRRAFLAVRVASPMKRHCPFCDGFRVGDKVPDTVKLCTKHDFTPAQKRRLRPWLLKTIDDEWFTELPARSVVVPDR